MVTTALTTDKDILVIGIRVTSVLTRNRIPQDLSLSLRKSVPTIPLCQVSVLQQLLSVVLFFTAYYVIRGKKRDTHFLQVFSFSPVSSSLRSHLTKNPFFGPKSD